VPQSDELEMKEPSDDSPAHLNQIILADPDRDMNDSVHSSKSRDSKGFRDRERDSREKVT